MEMDIRTALNIITGFLDGYIDEIEGEDERQRIEKAESVLYKYVEEKEALTEWNTIQTSAMIAFL